MNPFAGLIGQVNQSAQRLIADKRTVILRRLRSGETQAALSRETGVSRSTINRWWKEHVEASK